MQNNKFIVSMTRVLKSCFCYLGGSIHNKACCLLLSEPECRPPCDSSTAIKTKDFDDFVSCQVKQRYGHMHSAEPYVALLKDGKWENKSSCNDA